MATLSKTYSIVSSSGVEMNLSKQEARELVNDLISEFPNIPGTELDAEVLSFEDKLDELISMVNNTTAELQVHNIDCIKLIRELAGKEENGDFKAPLPEARDLLWSILQSLEKQRVPLGGPTPIPPRLVSLQEVFFDRRIYLQSRERLLKK